MYLNIQFCHCKVLQVTVAVAFDLWDPLIANYNSRRGLQNGCSCVRGPLVWFCAANIMNHTPLGKPSHCCPHLQERMGYRIQTATWKRFSPTPLRALRFSGHGLVGLVGLAAEARQRSHASELGYKWPISKSRAVAVLTVLTVLSLFSSHTEYCSSALLSISQWVPNPQTVPLLVPPWPAKKHKEISSEDIRTPLSEHWSVRFNDIQWLCMCDHVLQSAKNKESTP